MPPDTPFVFTLGEAVQDTQRKLKASGIEDAGREARLIVAAAAGVATAEIIVRPERLLDADAQSRLDAMVARRCAREPVSRIIGEREFYGRRFMLSAETLDPRPDSETLIEAALELVGRQRPTDQAVRILDIGTGTGCLLMTLLAELPHATGLGTDISAGALKTAAANAEALGLTDRASFARHDMLEGVQGPFDLVISNPPYIKTRVIPELAPEVRRFDPYAALDGGADGLEFYRRIANEIGRVLTGWAVLEVGMGQADAVALLFRQAFVKTRPAEVLQYQDLGGHTRCVAIRLQT